MYSRTQRRATLIAIAATSVLAALAIARALPGWSRPSSAAERRIAFVGVDVIPMDRERILRDQTVVTEGRRIVAVGPRSRVSSAGATIIDGRGKYLVPGLADTHTHMLFARDAAAYVAHGVTTIFDLGSFDEAGLMAIRDSISRELLLGPTILMAYFVDGPATANGRRVIETSDAAKAAVAAAKRKGFELIKAYNSIPASAALALLDEARAQHIAVIGHGIRSLGLERGLAHGQAAVAHAEEYFYAAVRQIQDEDEWRRAASFTKASHAFVIPNLSAYDVIERQWGRRAVLDSILRLDDVQSLAPLWQREWDRGSYTSRSGNLDGRTAILRRFTKMLSDSGVPLLLGTDSPGIPGLFPGSSALLDLQELEMAGLTRYQALEAATRMPGVFVARYVAHAERFGVVASGYRADLLLLDANPLDGLDAALARPVGVLSRGRWLPRASLDSVLTCLRAGRAKLGGEGTRIGCSNGS